MESMHNEGISVIIPTHAGRKSVVLAVQSLLSQADNLFEIIVVTDGDGTATRELLGEFHDPRLTLIEQPKAGSSATRNAGLAAAQHDWVAFVDDDDVPRDNWVSTFRTHMNDNVNAVTAGLALWREGRLVEKKTCHLDPDDKTLEASTMMAGAFVIRLNIVQAVGGYDTGLRAAQNQDLGLRICEHVNTHEVLGLWLEVEDTVIDVYAQEANARQARYGSAYADSSRIFLARYKDRLAKDAHTSAALLRIISRDDRLRGDFRSARQNALKAFRFEPCNLKSIRSLMVVAMPRLASTLEVLRAKRKR